MKRSILLSSLLVFTQLTGVSSIWAQVKTSSQQFNLQRGGSMDGGGGDASEDRVNEIRRDILAWINKGGHESLDLQNRMTYNDYKAAMINVLLPHAVVVSFVTTQQESSTTNPELKVSVGGLQKTCRGFISRYDRQRHILCNVERFASTPEAKQYRLIHHEYAGLARVEQNVAGSSDYDVSNQISEYLNPETILRLGLKHTEEVAKSFQAECVKSAHATNYLDISACEKIITPLALECVRVARATNYINIEECGRIKTQSALDCVINSRATNFIDINACAEF